MTLGAGDRAKVVDGRSAWTPPQLTTPNVRSGSRDISESRKEAVQNCFDRGLTLPQTAAEIGVPYLVAYRASVAMNLTFAHGNRRAPGSDSRAKVMAALYRDGYTLEQIGRQYGLTRERVRQIMTKHQGISGKDGGSKTATAKRREERKRVKDAACYRKYGCSFANYRELLKIGREMISRGVARTRTPVGAYLSQRHNAQTRKIEWKISLWEWWNIWQESGKWEQRGRGSGYVMARNGDEGPYAPDNVFICHATENNSNTKNKRSGLPIGVQLVVKGKYRAYAAQRMVGGKMRYLGHHKTPELAHAAYLAAASSVAA